MPKAIAGTINVQVTTPIKELADVAVWMYEQLGIHPRSASQIMATSLRTLHSALMKDRLLPCMCKNEEEAFELLKKVFGITLTPKYNDMMLQRQHEIDRTPGMAEFVQQHQVIKKTIKEIEAASNEPVRLTPASVSDPIKLKDHPFVPSNDAEDEVYEQAKADASANDPTDMMDTLCAELQKNKTSEEESSDG